MEGSRPLAFLSRRRFLYGALGVGTTAVAFGGAGAAWVWGAPAEVAGLRALSSFEFRTVDRIVDATFPPGGPIPVDARTLDLARAFDAYVADLPAPQRTDLKRALLLIELAPLVWDGLGTTFARLEPARRAEYWAGWGHSERLLQRQLSVVFRKFLNLLFYDTPAVWPHVGYLGPSFARLGSK